MELLSPTVSSYLDALVPPRDPVLADMEAAAAKTNFPIIGPASGHLCYLLARLMGARRIFELGSGFGYSTAWFARAVRENGGGIVHHVVWDQKLSQRAREHLGNLGMEHTVTFHVGEAVAALGNTEGPFDIIFNDIDKEGYPAALPVIFSKLRPGGLMITDNLLWSGRIFDETDESPATEGVRQLTKLVASDPRWISSIIPIRDGILVAMRSS
ncbi:MAG: methyltransferase [Ignavibacteria bacterium GWA2_55_11]|nr:MAG: methyltransferase [Ignavibacteria bacterium GWA2_55_11]OGU45549.1 MAG: methyltransferase [Ignavibacteria bacterium GWC2_56_12]OGU64361.1 MAG: methyltransferase [Ignavibacteria bacterium RIFCSPHIGHO2_02_FULL_56_12]OGU70804.1 MAG: methyltransferase [Ignavibacteria bacterium RIFCSPLOWO2_02_FULL_55_14]OGU75665.1 MAG: methyltransferase [Ignavibacteria bacterium RIFCSPLOWO2_12_FULL_56_21]HAV24478.1 O-methyltransferase [Bacteroidota bacterium]